MGFGNNQRPRSGGKQYNNTNRWSLFPNDRKRGQKDPDYSGTLNIDGVEYWINAWEGRGGNGPIASGTVRRKEHKKPYDRAGDYQRPEPRRAEYDDTRREPPNDGWEPPSDY
jgi:hypothetical protein